jgi:hypothetical protein
MYENSFLTLRREQRLRGFENNMLWMNIEA